ncbi:haloacid dehalogenase superfamily, subfamily IA, variant 3 with third motif having DD or ED [Streptomyces sp. DvalAA-14]|uniref:HAD-IA family hydrolase n=1 Tax=unclassified Streptomyces TaxID=2593676 RepID=UPI00081B7A24|nr:MULTISPECIES: HAD-IA family hydrolase [unclassified Streptomyces]MYS22245.1 HAD-IA family hydrolase [Streptomyces sp. SID4948]SCE11962.1 haloacid dehalogenase superfamily, subfamily IA, variant 3 with third motif having DD or ED [Streptomyces sp. DvalAA-14]
MPALVFDCDGVLADTERYGHLPAFNQTFDEFGLPVRWSDREYAEKVKVGGGKERMKTLLTPEFIARAGLPTDPDALNEEVARWHRRKTEIYTEIISSGAIPARPGVRRLAAEAHDAGWALAVASTSAEPSVRSVLELAAGPELSPHFSVFAGDIVPRKKPAPDIYTYAVDRLGLDPAGVLVVEDSRNGMLAALGAGLTCTVTTSAYTGQEDFTGASLVVSSLGDPPPEQTVTEVLADPLGSEPRPLVRLADLAFLLATTTGPGPAAGPDPGAAPGPAADPGP